jgi:hypothetical protein
MESLRTADGIELVGALAQRILQELIEAEATAHIGAAPGEHSKTRTTMHNGHREKVLTTQAGDLDLAIPKVSAPDPSSPACGTPCRSRTKPSTYRMPRQLIAERWCGRNASRAGGSRRSRASIAGGAIGGYWLCRSKSGVTAAVTAFEGVMAEHAS